MMYAAEDVVAYSAAISSKQRGAWVEAIGSCEAMRRLAAKGLEMRFHLILDHSRF